MITTRSDVLEALSSFQRSQGREFGILRLGVLGSAARDRLEANSDVDVVVELERPDLLLLVAIKQELEELLGMPVDVVRYRSDMNPLLKRHIEQEAIYA